MDDKKIQEQLDWIADSIMDLQDIVLSLAVKPKSTRQEKDLHNSLKTAFLDYYKKTFQNEYYWEVKDSVATKRIIKKIAYKVKAKTQAEATNEEILRSFQIVIESISDDWILANISVNLIDSKFNQLVSQLRNTKQAKGDAERQSDSEAFEQYDASKTS